MLNALILAVVVLAGGVLILPRVANSLLWRATITPLASIIGSGFLVLGPILDVSYGGYAPLVMAGLCALAYLFGSAIRFNIAQIDSGPARLALTHHLDTAASMVLAFAFVISVAYYLNLFGAFGVSLTALDNSYNARLLTTSVFAVILLVGWTRGFAAMERMEQVTVGIKLAIIAGLLFGLVVYFGEATQNKTLAFEPAQISGWAAFTLAAGLMVTVQGFETSRYLGNAYSAALRIRSMRMAQWVSTIIYMAYIVLLTYALDAGSLMLSETAIIDLTAIVAPVLPLLLVAAALSAQFSAAVADTSGAGGLIAEFTKGKVSEKSAYGVLVIVGVILTWTADVFQIISYASRAFAAYYALQAGIAAISAYQTGNKGKSAFFTLLACVGLTITIFGQAVE